MVRRLLMLAAVGLVAPAARADVALHPLFTDNMVLQRDAEVPVTGTAGPKDKVSVTLAGGDGPATVVEATADDKGNWKAALPKAAAGTGYTLTVKAGDSTVTLKDVAVGDVWVCSGQSNMEWSINASWDAAKYKAASKNPDLRLFTVKKTAAAEPIPAGGDLKHLLGWKPCGPDTVAGFSAVGYHFGAAVQKELKVPVGLINTSWGGTSCQAWTSREALRAADLGHYADQKPVPNQPGAGSVLFNAMIHPLLGFPIKGAIWYQGESNTGRAAEYYTLFPTMIKDWRARWKQEFPFYCVQLAPFLNGDADGVSYAELRDAQRNTAATLPNAGMAVITDVGDLLDIHPKDKFTVGSRLAKAALVQTYGKSGVAGGPVYKEAKFDGDKAIVTFDRIGGGLAAKTGPNGYNAAGAVNGFEVCGDDRVFHPAKAKVAGETVVVSCDRVAKPVAVRFGWKNYPVVNLFNKDGFPASPFRTDDFPLTTAAKK
jgi:sialate O-acetylesterase